MSWRSLLLTLGSLALSACIGSAPQFQVDDEWTPRLRSRDVILASDLVHSHSPTVYDAILEVRPDFFERRARRNLSGQLEGLRVFVDDVDVGDVDALRTLPLGPVTSVRYVYPGDAEFRWGRQASGAVILVTTAR